MAQPIINDPKSKTALYLEMGLSSNYGQSTASLIVEAIQVHRDTCFNLMFEQIREGEYENAYVYYQNHQDLSGAIDVLLYDAMKVAEKNSLAYDCKANPGGHRVYMDRLPSDKAERYKSFLKLILSGEIETQD